MKRLLIAAPGYRDPFWCEEFNVRPSAPAPEKSAANRWLESTADGLRHRYELRRDPDASLATQEGPILSCLRLMRNDGWVADEILLPFVPDGQMMNVRVRAMQTVGSHFLAPGNGQRQGIIPLPLDGALVAQYDSVFRHLRSAFRERIEELRKSEEVEIRILVGPGTPALNFALILLAYDVLPKASIWQALDLRAGSKPVMETRLIPLPMDVEHLPVLAIDGSMPAFVKALEARLQALESELEIRPVATPLDPAETPECLRKQALELKTFQYKTAVHQELENARSEGRRFSQTKAYRIANLLTGEQVSRQAFLGFCDGHDIRVDFK